MAISKVLHMKQAKSGYKAKHLANGLSYIMNPEKTGGGRYISGSGCIPENALAQMLETKRHFGKEDKRQGYHFIISFEEGEVTEENAFQVMGQFVEEYLGKDFEAVYAVHNDTDHIHGHLIFNSVRCTDGRKYDYPKGEWEYRIQPLVNRLCKEHGLSVLNMEEVEKKRKRRREGRKEEKALGSKISENGHRLYQDSQWDEVQEAEFFYIFIPYRNRHLTRHQKECFLRKYRAGKIHSNPKTREYKASCQALKRLQEEYLFWAEHGIQSRTDIQQAVRQAKERLQDIRVRKKKLAEEKRQYQEVFLLLEELEGCELEAELYQERYPEFSKEYQKYQKICSQLDELGVPLAEARRLELYFQTELDKLDNVRKELLKQKRIALRLEAKLCRQDLKQKEQDYLEKDHKGWGCRMTDRPEQSGRAH